MSLTETKYGFLSVIVVNKRFSVKKPNANPLRLEAGLDIFQNNKKVCRTL
jgi:hypothetical protein